MHALTQIPMRRLFLLLLTLTALAACQTQKGRHDGVWPYPEPPGPGGPYTNPDGTPVPLPGAEGQPAPAAGDSQVAMINTSRPLPNVPKSAEEISKPPVLALIRQARQARSSGRPDQAQAYLERALRIDQRDYFAWSALAATYLDQKNYEQAVSVAQKSNSLARGNIYVELDNYRVMQLAREAQGDPGGALQAQARADEIQNWIQSATPATP